jgi:peptide/nickel transport system substrate-binding protein
MSLIHRPLLPHLHTSILLALLALTACQSAPAPTALPATLTLPATATSTPEPTVTPAPTSLSAVEEPPSPTPVSRIFTIALAQAPGTLDPANAADESALLITRHVYAGLTRFEAGTTRVAPALAERWETSADGLTWTFHLRPGVSFSDGAPFTALAAQQNFVRWNNAHYPGQYTFWRLMFGGFADETDATGEPLSNLADVTALDETTLHLTLRRPDAALPATLAMPAFALVSPLAFNVENFGAPGAPSAGAGPFVLANFTPEGMARLTRNPAYWGAPPAPDELIFKSIPDDTQRLLALQTGEVEGVARVNPAHYALIQNDPALRLEFGPALNVAYLGFNQARAPWNVRECRMAAATALNRQRYVAEVFPGDADVAESILPPAVEGHQPPEIEFQYDPAEAARLWQACRDSGVSVPVTMTLYTPPSPRAYLPDPAAVGAAIQADLAAVSITVQLAAPEWQSRWLPDVQGGRADLFLLGWVGVNGDPDSFLCPLFCGVQASFNSDIDGAPLPPDAELAQWLTEARAAAQADERARLYGLAQARLWRDVIVLPLAHRKTAWAFRADVLGATLGPLEATFFGLARGP